MVNIRKRKRHQEVAELLKALQEEYPSCTVYVAWNNANMNQYDEVKEVVRGAADRLVLLYLPTYSPWLTPIEMLWRHFRHEVTHCELYETVKALIEASHDFFKRFNKNPEKTLSIIGCR